MERCYDAEAVLQEASYIEDQKRILFDHVFERNGLLMTWAERGPAINIAYEMLGRWYAGDQSISYHDVVVQELEQDLLPMSEVVEKSIFIPYKYRFHAAKIYEDLTQKFLNSSEKGSTGLQLRAFMRKQQERLNNGEYRRPGEDRKD